MLRGRGRGVVRGSVRVNCPVIERSGVLFGACRLRMVSGMRIPDPTVYALTRVTGPNTLPATIDQRANAFATTTEDCAWASLWMTRDESGVRTYLVLDGPEGSVSSASVSLAHAVGARAEVVESFPSHLAQTPGLARMVVHETRSVARQPMVGTDPAEIARIMAVHLRVGDWVGVSVRRPTDKESVRNQDWIQHRLTVQVGAHQSQSRDARTVSFWAGSSSNRAARSLLARAASAMQGFDLQVKAESVTPWAGARGWLVASLAGVAVSVGAVFVPNVPSSVAWGSVAAAAALALVGVLRLVGVLSCPSSVARDLVSVGVLPVPPKRRGRPAPPREAETRRDGKKVAERPGDYPLHRAAFLVQPSIFVGLASPHAGTDAGAASAQRRSVPIPMTGRIGPLVGFDGDTPAYLSNTASYAGVAVVGRPGSGKSVLVRSLFGWACMERVHPSGLPSAPGANNTLIAFESKDHHAVEAYRAWSAAAGDKLLVVELGDPAAYGIDLFATPGSVAQRAEAFVNAMVYAFGDGDIQNRSFDVLKRIYTGALALDEHRDVLDGVPWIDGASASVNHFADVLIGNHGDPRAVQLAQEVMTRSRVPETWSPSLALAAEALAYLFESRTEAQRRSLVEAAQNKVSQFAALEHWWAPTKRKVTWDQVLSTTPGQRAVVINTGASASGPPVEDRLTELMSALVMFTLQQAIRRLCAGWEDEGRSVSIFSDELSLLAGTSEKVIAWLKEQGRAFGVRPVLATQRPAQLPPKVRTVILNFGTLICFNQDSVTTAEEVSREMFGADGPIEAAEIMHLPDYHAMVRAYVGKERQPAFTMKAGNFEADRAAAVESQGYSVPNTVPGVSPLPVPAPPAPVADPVPVVPLDPADAEVDANCYGDLDGDGR